MNKIELHIEGMHCGSCAVGIQMLTSQMDGVKSAEVSYEGKKGVFEFDPAKVSYDQLLDIFWRNINPTQADGQFADIGLSYQAAIYYGNEEERKIAEDC